MFAAALNRIWIMYGYSQSSGIRKAFLIVFSPKIPSVDCRVGPLVTDIFVDEGKDELSELFFNMYYL